MRACFSSGRWVSLSLVFATALPGTRSAPIAWERVSLAMPESIWSVAVADVNGDGKQDLIAVGVTQVIAVLQPGGTQRILFDAKDGKMLYAVTLDMDADGDLDLAIGRYLVPEIEHRKAVAAGKAATKPVGPDFSIGWLENTGASGTPWSLHVIDRELNGTHGLWVGDVDGDGRRDLIANSISGPAFPNSVVWFRTPARGGDPFVRHIVTKSGADGRPHYLDFGDVNRDGRGDILLGDSGGGTFTWWERPTAGGESWTKHLIAREAGATNLKLADVDGDGKPDVVGSCGHGKGVYWFRGDTWERQSIDAALANPHALAVGDFDRDGDMDVATASYTAFVVRWYENDGRGNFTAHTIESENRQQAYDLKALDVDGDGALDLVLAGRESRNLVWYRNRR
jgi:hypothetical protein